MSEVSRILGLIVRATPYVEGETPVVCAWYSTARAASLWNLSEQRLHLTLCHGGAHRPIRVDELDVALIEGIDVWVRVSTFGQNPTDGVPSHLVALWSDALISTSWTPCV